MEVNELVGIVLVGHNPYAGAVQQATQMIFGEVENVHVINLHHDTNLDAFTEMVMEVIEEANDGDGVLVLADLLGGSPANAVAYALTTQAGTAGAGDAGDASGIGQQLTFPLVELVTGVNLPMLLEVLATRSWSTLSELKETALRAGVQGVVDVGAMLKGG